MNFYMKSGDMSPVVTLKSPMVTLKSPVVTCHLVTCQELFINVGRHDHLDVTAFVEAIKLIEHQHRELNLLPPSRFSFAPLGSDGVDLIYEDDARTVLLGHPGQLLYKLWTLPSITSDE